MGSTCWRLRTTLRPEGERATAVREETRDGFRGEVVSVRRTVNWARGIASRWLRLLGGIALPLSFFRRDVLEGDGALEILASEHGLLFPSHEDLEVGWHDGWMGITIKMNSSAQCPVRQSRELRRGEAVEMSADGGLCSSLAYCQMVESVGPVRNHHRKHWIFQQ